MQQRQQHGEQSVPTARAAKVTDNGPMYTFCRSDDIRTVAPQSVRAVEAIRREIVVYRLYLRFSILMASTTLTDCGHNSTHVIIPAEGVPMLARCYLQQQQPGLLYNSQEVRRPLGSEGARGRGGPITES